jgi:hypothetical protein
MSSVSGAALQHFPWIRSDGESGKSLTVRATEIHTHVLQAIVGEARSVVDGL